MLMFMVKGIPSISTGYWRRTSRKFSLKLHFCQRRNEDLLCCAGF